jgi:hypothetical protein
VPAREESQRDPNVSQGKQPVHPGHYATSVEDCNDVATVSSADPIRQSDFPMMENPITSSRVGTGAQKVSYFKFLSADDIPIGARSRPGCAKFFSILNRAKWDPLCRPNRRKSPDQGPEPLELEFVKRVNDHLFRVAARVSIYGNLAGREFAVKLRQLQQENVEQNIANGIPRNRAVKLATASSISAISKGSSGDKENQSTAKFVMSITRSLDRSVKENDGSC